MRLNPLYSKNTNMIEGDFPYINVPEWLGELSPGDWILFEKLSDIPFYVVHTDGLDVYLGHPDQGTDYVHLMRIEAIAVLDGKYCGRTEERKWRRYVPVFGAAIHPYACPV